MTTTDLLGLSPATLDKLNSVFARHNAIDSVLIYGSRAKGNYRAGSDIDLTIKGNKISFEELMQIEDQIDDLMLPYTVDISQFDQLGSVDLVEHINRVGVRIYAKDRARDVAIAKNLSETSEKLQGQTTFPKLMS